MNTAMSWQGQCELENCGWT